MNNITKLTRRRAQLRRIRQALAGCRRTERRWSVTPKFKTRPVTLRTEQALDTLWMTVLRARCSAHFAICDIRHVYESNYRPIAPRWRVTHIGTGALVGALHTLWRARLYVRLLEAFGGETWVSSDIKDYQCKCTGCKARGIGAFLAQRVRDARWSASNARKDGGA